MPGIGTNPYAEDTPARSFIEDAAPGQHKHGIDGISEGLEKRPPNDSIGKPGYRRRECHRAPDEDGKRMVLEVVREAVDPAANDLVALLENRNPSPSMYDPPPGEFHRFAIYPQAYEDEEWKTGHPSCRSKDV